MITNEATWTIDINIYMDDAKWLPGAMYGIQYQISTKYQELF